MHVSNGWTDAKPDMLYAPSTSSKLGGIKLVQNILTPHSPFLNTDNRKLIALSPFSKTENRKLIALSKTDVYFFFNEDMKDFSDRSKKSVK